MFNGSASCQTKMMFDIDIYTLNGDLRSHARLL